MSQNTSKSTGRPCTICTHKRVKDIDRQIAQHGSFRNISKQWLGSEKHYTSVFRHATTHLKLDIQSLRSEAKIERAVDVYNEFSSQLVFTKKLRDAAERWLTDPDDPEQFELTPRADEIDVVYFDQEDKDENNKPKRKKASLQELLAKLSGTRYETDAQLIKTVDLRDFTLKTLDRCDMTIDKFAKLGGEYTKEKDNSTTIGLALKAYQAWAGKNPNATPIDHEDAIRYFAGDRIDPDALAKAAQVDLISTSIN